MIFNQENITNYLSSDEFNYKIFDILYTEDEINTINNFNLTNFNTYNNYGENNLEDLEEYLKNNYGNSSESINKMSEIIKKICGVVLESYNVDSYWLTIRTTKPTQNFDVPRWHCDGPFFKSEKPISKFVTIFKGPGTLLYDLSKEERKNFFIKNQECKYELKNPVTKEVNSFSIEFRNCLNKKIENTGNIIQLLNKQCVIFYAGSEKICGIHSEPKKM